MATAMRVVLVGSSGGHLTQLAALRPWWQDWQRTWVTFDTPDAVSLLFGEECFWAAYPTTRNLPNLVRNTWLAWRVLRQTRPDIVVSTGAAVALPFFALARALRIPTAYIEVYDRIDSATLSARLCRPFTSLMCVQWAEQRNQYPGAELIGPLL